MIERFARAESSCERSSKRIEFFTSLFTLLPSPFLRLPFAPGLWRGRRGRGLRGPARWAVWCAIWIERLMMLKPKACSPTPLSRQRARGSLVVSALVVIDDGKIR